jgi:1,4-alpha-glucan branching enzyme
MVADQLARSMLLALASDWAFMITKDSAADYARRRHFCHHSDTHRLAAVIADQGADSVAAFREGAEQRAINGPFGRLDARQLR